MADKNSGSISYAEDLETSLSAMERHISDFVPSTPVHQTSMITVPLISGKEETDSQGHTKPPGANGLFKAGGLSLLAAYQQSSIVDPERRRRNKKKRHLSKWAWCFLVLAFLQVIIVSGLQIAIAVLGQFDSGRLEDYVPCVTKQLSLLNQSLPDNSTFPSFGKDKQIYVFIFMFLTLYNFALCLYAMFAQRIVEVFTFVVINVLTMGYTSLQVYQFRGFGEFCDPITLVGWLALGNVLIVLVFTIVFGFLLIQIYVEFGWKVYKFVNCNPALRYYYRVYEIFLSIVKVLIVFTIVFLIGQCALILPLSNYEFWLSYPYMIGMILLFFYAYLAVRRESHIAMLILFIIGILLTVYFIFKVVRYITRSCPVCKLLDEQLDHGKDRREDFEHLVMMASLNVIICLVYLFFVYRVWRQNGRGLADHFYIHGHWFDRIWKKPPREDAYVNSGIGTGTMMKKSNVNQPLVSSQRRGSALEETGRNSSLDEVDCNSGVVFTPLQEFTSLPLMDVEPINRTTSLPPIMEEKRH